MQIQTKYDDAVFVTTEHAHSKPRGEVYLSVFEQGVGHGAPVALTPQQAEEIARELLAAAEHAKTMPEATLDYNGDPL